MKKIVLLMLSLFLAMSYTSCTEIKEFEENQKIENEYNKAEEWYREKDYGNAIGIFERLAEQGHSGAQYYLGWMYYKGEGVSRNYDRAIYWMKKSAKGGDRRAKGWCDEHKVSY